MRAARRLAALAGCLALAAGNALGDQPIGPEWADAWRGDLAFLEQKLLEIHPDPFAQVPRSEISTELASLVERAPELAQHQMIVELARVIARLGDGHTRLTLPLAPDSGFFLGHTPTAPPEIPDAVLGHLPVRFALFADGLFVTRAAADLAGLAGGRVVSLGDLGAEEAIAAVAPVVHRDNEPQLRFQLPDFLAVPEVLHASGVTRDRDRVRVEIETPAGERRVAALARLAGGEAVTWTEAYGEAPSYLAHRDKPFWFEAIDGGRSVYFQFNEVADGPDETLAQFCRRLFAVVERPEVERLILDLRWNRGGGNHLNRALIHHLIRSEKLERPGAFFVVTGGGTFSAAMMLAIDIERHTNAIFVGEPTGSTPNHHGDARKVRLPATGLTVRISTLYWQYSGPGDRRPAIRPHLPVAVTGADYRAGRDPALAAILQAGAATADWPGRWRGRMAIDGNDIDLSLEIERRADGWTGAVDLPLLGLEGFPVEDLRVAGDRLGFRLPTARVELEVEARREGRRLYGLTTANGVGRAYPLALSRDD